MFRCLPISCLLTLLVACSSIEAPRYELPDPASGSTLGTHSNSIEVREVSLPLYAEKEEIYAAAADGSIQPHQNALWADAPARAITQHLVDSLSKQTRARVAAEPWPFESYPDTRVIVRFSRIIAGADGNFNITGQFFIAPLSGNAEKSRGFDLSVPYNPADLASLSTAKGKALSDLARQIIKSGL